MDKNYKIVYYEKYCNQCIHQKKSENEPPCDTCLDSPANQNSHKPISFKKK